MHGIRYILHLAFAFIGRFKNILLVGAVLGILSFLLLSFVTPVIFTRTSEKIGIAGRYHTDTLPTSILSMISDGLTRLNENGTPEPNLASLWETPDKGRTWIFTLDEKILWQDSKPVTSSSVVYEFSDLNIERPDEKTIVFKLQNPFSPFPVVVSRPTFRKGLLGTGSWKVKKLSLAGSYVQEITLINSKKDKKIFKFYPTLERTKLAYKLGEVDKIINIYDPSPFREWKTSTTEGAPNFDQVVTLFFNTSDEILSEKSVRQALTYAIEKGSLGYERAISPISPNSWAYNPQTKQYNYDPKRAKELLDGLPNQLKENLQIKLVSASLLLPIAEKIAKDWESVGVKTTVQVSSIIPQEFQVFLTIFDIPKDPDQYSIWHSTQSSTNISRYSNPRIDKLLEDGRVELDFKERRKIYLDFQRFLAEDIPATFLYHPTYYTISRK